MSSRTVELELNLPRDTADSLRMLAKLAGVSMQSVVRVIIAREVLIRQAAERLVEAQE